MELGAARSARRQSFEVEVDEAGLGRRGRRGAPAREPSRLRVVAPFCLGGALIIAAITCGLIWHSKRDSKRESLPVVVQARAVHQDCAAAEDAIPKVLRIVAEHCDADKINMVRTNIERADTSCFEVLCYPGVYREAYVKEHFSEWADFYTKLPLPVMKADVFRMMVLYREGGFYLDDDVELYPSFAAHFGKHSNQPMIVGWERREPEHKLGSYCSNMFCNSIGNYAFAAMPKSDVLKSVIMTAKAHFEDSKNLGRTRMDVTKGTGPERFTIAILSHHVNIDQILGIAAFGCGQWHSQAPPCDPGDQEQWLKHRFEGKWLGQVDN